MGAPGRWILAGLLLAAGCGGSVVAGTPDAGSASGATGGGASPAGGTSDSSGAGGVGGSAGAGGAGGAMVGPGHCTDPADMAADKASYPLPDGNGSGSIEEVAKACTLGCVSDAHPDKCALSCVAQQTNHAFSQACATCFVDSTTCDLQHCVANCLAGQAQCNACRCARGCVAQTVHCTGIPDDSCAAPAGG